jgi:Protein of unknown function (DUF998)
VDPIREKLVGIYRRSDERYRDQRRLAIATYRYLRIGMVLAVVAIGVSIVLERREVGCWQTSISAYYYTPARLILVGALAAIGASLIVIKGSNLAEDGCLNVAGMLAPLVAVIPTEAVAIDATGRPSCPASVSDSVTRIREPGDLDTASSWLRGSIDNNVNTLLIVGAIGVVVVLAVGFVPDRDGRSAVQRNPVALVFGVATASVVLVGLFVLHRSWGAFSTRAHGYAAVAMFVFLALAVLTNAVERWPHRGRPLFWIYAVTFVAMVLLGAWFQLIDDSTYHVFIVECIEIVAFVAFWTTQTVQHWDDPPAAHA